MRLDFYTRVVLTVIALCLVWLCIVLTPMGTPLRAQAGIQDVRIVGIKEPPIRRVQRIGEPTRAERVGDWDALPTR